MLIRWAFAREVHDAVVLRARGELAHVARGASGHEHALAASHHRVAVRPVLRFQQGLQAFEPGLANVLRHLVGQLRRGCPRARAVDEAEGAVEAHVVDELHRLLEVGVGFTGEAHDEVRRERQVGACGAKAAHDRLVFERRVAALHRREHAVGPRLHRQVKVAGPAWRSRRAPR